MKVVVQRVKNAKVEVENKLISEIDNGLLVFVGFTENDSLEQIEKMARKVINLRIFPDENNVMNKSVLDEEGKILSVSQFTLYADTKKGNRPSYVKALGGNEAKLLYDKWNQELEKYIDTKTGVFGADMNVSFTNLGPTTIILET